MHVTAGIFYHAADIYCFSSALAPHTQSHNDTNRVSREANICRSSAYASNNPGQWQDPLNVFRENDRLQMFLWTITIFYESRGAPRILTGFSYCHISTKKVQIERCTNRRLESKKSPNKSFGENGGVMRYGKKRIFCF